MDPYLQGIAEEMKKYCQDKKTVVFLPLVKTSQKFRDLLNENGFRAAEVNGDSQDRAEILKDFDAGKYNVLCNSMLLTEGWDCPSVDCIVVLRPTKVRSLYCQMVGRGTRLSPETGKDHLLLLDFLWHTERHELCHPASLICENAEVAQKMTENLEKEAGMPVDIEEAEKKASEDVVAQREESLAKQLAEMKRRKKKLVDPLQFEMSIQAEDLSSYVPSFGWEMGPPSDKQKNTLEKLGILPDQIDNAGKAAKFLDRLEKRRNEGLTTPKQIRFLEGRGFQHVGTWQFETAKNLIDRIAGNGWRIPTDARILKTLRPKSILPLVDYVLENSQNHDYETELSTVYISSLSDVSLENASFSISSLERLGIITINKNSFIPNESIYIPYEETTYYKNFSLKAISRYASKRANIHKYLGSFTPLGENFYEVCVK